jgi:hypothetical protein
VYYLAVGLLNVKQSNRTHEPMKPRDVALTKRTDAIHTSHTKAIRRGNCKFDVLDSSYMCMHVWGTHKAPVGPIRGSNVTSSLTGHVAACPPHFIQSPVWRLPTCSDTYCRPFFAIRCLAHGGFTRCGQSCFRRALPQIDCRQNGRTTTPGPIAKLSVDNARRSSVVAQKWHSVGASSISLM